MYHDGIHDAPNEEIAQDQGNRSIQIKNSASVKQQARPDCDTYLISK
jgi:hypothetical protein